MTNVRNYTTDELLKKAKEINGFKNFPKGHWILAIRSNEDDMTFDDKFYLFKGESFIMVTSGTTNKGKKGTAVLCSNQWTYDCYKASDGVKVRHHKDRMPCLRQVKGIPYSRDYSNDSKTNPTSKVFTDIISTNFHVNTYDMKTTVIKTFIEGWSEGCLVVNDVPKYLKILEYCRESDYVSLCIIQEF